MNKNNYYKNLFLIAGIWNICASIPFIIFGKEIVNLLNLKMQFPPLQYSIWLYLFLAIVFTFGIGYFMVGKNIDKNHGIVVLGIITKVIVFIVFAYYYFFKENILDILIFLIGVGDLVFSILFLEFLKNHKVHQ